MSQQNICIVNLPSSHPEYIYVASQFNKTCSTFIMLIWCFLVIERIQNLDLWNIYQTMKTKMDAKNSNIINEKQLFYGINADSVCHINRNGCNRSYAGKHVALYGKGIYFAVNASYSADDTYSKPDANGKKYMYYAQVLTGVYTRGNNFLIEPPPRNPQDPTDKYDSVTDDVQNPTLFVIFNDFQTYPEYLIIFQN